MIGGSSYSRPQTYPLQSLRDQDDGPLGSKAEAWGPPLRTAGLGDGPLLSRASTPVQISVTGMKIMMMRRRRRLWRRRIVLATLQWLLVLLSVPASGRHRLTLSMNLLPLVFLNHTQLPTAC